ncbi:NUDIX domain-containing protein [Cohnella endophytica]|uniref:NUDIX domain-containing protein n=1 Tax=Cohnella endophytica TaxID=2419778 RepID=A0A494Y261_9BACL|nr:NUDIX hydrolase [Cohnella endophytica]RKP56844.1 NUDIX domain-containing protein [Cohnella endophytica]
MELKWLSWAKQIQAISQTGLAYTKDAYDQERFEMLRELSVEILNEYTQVESEIIRDLFARETGYATPKVDIRCVVIQANRLLLVKEKLDGAWALPGGWADVGLSPKEIAVKEAKEESGLDVQPVRLLAVLDKKNHGHPPAPSHVYKMFILCEVIGGTLESGLETTEAAWFDRNALPELSAERNTEAQIVRVWDMVANDEREVWLD